MKDEDIDKIMPYAHAAYVLGLFDGAGVGKDAEYKVPENNKQEIIELSEIFTPRFANRLRDNSIEELISLLKEEGYTEH